MIDSKCIEDFVRIALRSLSWPKLVQSQEGAGGYDENILS